MKIKKMIGLLLSIAIISPTFVAAAGTSNKIDVTAGVSNNTVTINISSDQKAAKKYSVSVLCANTEERDSFDDTNATMSNIYRVQQVEGSGTVSCSFKMTDTDPLGKYTVVVGGDIISSDSKKVTFFLRTTDTIVNQALLDLNGAAETNMASVLLANADSAWIADINGENFKNNSSAMMKTMYNEKGTGYTSEAEVEAAFEFASRLVDLSNATESNLKSYLTMYKDSLRCTVPDEFLDGTEEVIKAFCDLKTTQPLTGSKSLESLFKNALALGNLNKAERTEVIGVLLNNEAIFGANIYSLGYNSSMEYEFSKAMADKEFTDISSIAGFVSSTIQGISTSNGVKQSGGGGGGGGKVTTGIGATGTITKKDIEETRENKALVFNDVAESFWAKDYIEYLAYNEIMLGDGKTVFRPNDNITREEFVSLLTKVITFDPATTKAADFTDIDEQQWYYSAINTAVLNGITNGMGDGTFGVGKTITRQDAVTMIYNAKNAKEILLKKQEIDVSYSDTDEFADYSRDIINDISKTGIIKGYEDNTFRPNGLLTRAEAAKMMYSLIDLAYGLKNGGQI